LSIFSIRLREEDGWDDTSYTNDANPFGDPNLTATFRFVGPFDYDNSKKQAKSFSF
jgi:hypothetical protein